MSSKACFHLCFSLVSLQDVSMQMIILIALLYWNLTGDMQIRDVDKRENEEIYTLRIKSERF